jgi:predicted CXXCH cytochrome family protein
MQCHLEGDAAVEQPGRHFYEFQPGESMSDFVHYFVKADVRGEGMRAGSQFEALWQSTCKRKSGDTMSCLSCHDPHTTPKPEERAAYFRSKCLACHGEKFAASRHAKQTDCLRCHMPPVPSSDIAHTQATDHRIPRRIDAGFEDEQEKTFAQLKEFPPQKQEPGSLRDVALAWAALSKREASFAERQAERLLPKAVAQNPEDPALLLAYGYAEQRRGAYLQARALYEHALRPDPDQSEGESNLAVIEARTGDVPKAIALARDAFHRTPWQSSIGLDLALLLCDAGQYDEARSVTLRLLQFNPDSAAGRQMMRVLLADRPSGCRDLEITPK